MPKMPKWMGDFSERAFKSAYKPTIITEVDYHHAQLKRIRFQGETLRNTDWIAAQEIEFRVSDTEYRHYTPLCWNSKLGYTDVLFYLHGLGPGSDWANNLKKGDRVNLIGPAGKFTLSSGISKVIMIGDETTLSAYKGMADQLAENNSAYQCVLEMAPAGMNWADLIGLPATSLESIPSDGGRVLSDWLGKYLLAVDEARDSTYYLSGNATTIKTLRKMLLDERVSSKQIFSKPYWMQGKRGL